MEVGANPVQVETGEFDEAIEVEEDVAAESEFQHRCDDARFPPVH